MWPTRTVISAIYRITDSHKDGGGQERRIRMAKKRETIIFRCTAKEKEELKSVLEKGRSAGICGTRLSRRGLKRPCAT